MVYELINHSFENSVSNVSFPCVAQIFSYFPAIPRLSEIL